VNTHHFGRGSIIYVVALWACPFFLYFLGITVHYASATTFACRFTITVHRRSMTCRVKLTCRMTHSNLGGSTTQGVEVRSLFKFFCHNSLIFKHFVKEGKLMATGSSNAPWHIQPASRRLKARFWVPNLPLRNAWVDFHFLTSQKLEP